MESTHGRSYKIKTGILPSILHTIAILTAKHVVQHTQIKKAYQHVSYLSIDRRKQLVIMLPEPLYHNFQSYPGRSAAFTEGLLQGDFGLESRAVHGENIGGGRLQLPR